MKLLTSTIIIYAGTAPCAMGFVQSLHKGAFRTFGEGFQSTNFKDRFVGLNMVDAQLPTLEQAGKDSFMQQISHAGELVALLNENNSEVDDQIIVELLSAQLSHVDGLRGFFATYLTEEGVTAADQDEIPPILWEAMQNVDQKQLIDIACKLFLITASLVIS